MKTIQKKDFTGLNQCYGECFSEINQILILILFKIRISK